MSALPFSRLDWMIAWRHLRVGDALPTWVRWVNVLSIYLVLAGGFIAWQGGAMGADMGSVVEAADAIPTPLQRYYGTFGGLTLVAGAMGLTLGLLARMFNLLPTIITMSVLLGCMALVVVLSLMSGLEEDLRAKILNQKAHVRISRKDGRPFDDYVPLVRALEHGRGLAGASPYLEGEIMVRSGLNRQGAILAGIVPERQTQVSDLEKLVEEGSYRFLEHPEEIPDDLDAFGITDVTPWRLRHLAAERKKNATRIQEAQAQMSKEGRAQASAEAARGAQAAAEAAQRAAAASVVTGDSGLDPTLPSKDVLPAAPPDLGSAADTSALLRALPAPPAPGPRDVVYEIDDGWEDPQSELPSRAEDGAPDEVEPEHAPVDASDEREEPAIDAVHHPILIGRELASELSVHVGADVQLLTPVGRVTPAGQIPGVLAVKVAGIFFSGMYEYDRKNVYAPLDVVQRFLLTGDQVTGIEVKLEDVEAIDDGKRETETIVARLGRDELMVEDWRDLNRNLFSAMFLEKVAMFIALLFVVLVASFGILASNLMSVMEKSKEIAILKAMGMSDGGIMRIFIAEGLCVGLLGSFGGIAIGLAMCWALDRYGLPLNENVYYIEKLPVVVNPTEVALVGIAAMVIVCFSSVYPALVASRTRPVDGLRQSAS